MHWCWHWRWPDAFTYWLSSLATQSCPIYHGSKRWPWFFGVLESSGKTAICCFLIWLYLAKTCANGSDSHGMYMSWTCNNPFCLDTAQCFSLHLVLWVALELKPRSRRNASDQRRRLKAKLSWTNTNDNAQFVLNTDPESGPDDRSWNPLGCDFPFGIYCCKLQSKAPSASKILTQCHSWIIDAAIQGLGWLFFTPSWPRRSGKGLREGGSFLWNATRTKEGNPRCALTPWNCRTEFALCFQTFAPTAHACKTACTLWP